MSISVIATSGQTLSTGSGTEALDLPGTPLENDIIVLSIACDNDLSGDGLAGAGATSGYTYVPSTESQPTSDVNPGWQLAWKRMGASPDSSVTLARHVSLACGVAMMLVRGVDTTTAIDAEGTSDNSGSGYPNPGSITTQTDGALVVICGLLDDDDDAANVTHPAYTNVVAGDHGTGSTSVGATAMLASTIKATAGLEDPAAFAGNGDDAWRAKTFALRPASSEPITASALDGIDLGEDITTALGDDSGPDGIFLGDFVASPPTIVPEGILLGDSVLAEISVSGTSRELEDIALLGDTPEYPSEGASNPNIDGITDTNKVKE